MTDTDSKPKLTQEDKVSFIQEVRSRRKKIAHAFDENETGIMEIFKQLYPDSVHFIYELLQNAEDAGATKVCFNLSKNHLGFEHNGRSFSETDVWSITTVARSSKSDNDGTIGRFGIGFRSVFVYTNTPRIWSPTYSFFIEDFVIPHHLPDQDDLGNLTRFELPFNNPDKNPKDAYNEISKKLNNISDDTLLFLNNIESIEWKIDKSDAGMILREVANSNHVEITKRVSNEIVSSSHFLLFSKPLHPDHTSPAQCVSIAYSLDVLSGVGKVDSSLPLSDQVKIVPVKGNVAVFFPAVKETSGLRFHIHAPFISVPNRDSIKNTDENELHFTSLATLCCKSLHVIRDFGLLTRDFFGTLPNSKDDLGENYTGIRERIIQEFNNQPLMLTHAGGYAPAKTLCQARESLKSLLTIQDLKFLGNFEPDSDIDWAVNSDLQGSDVERFMSSTSICEWGIDNFIEVISNRLDKNAISKDHLSWLSQKPTSWLQVFYSIFDNDLTKCTKKLANSVIVKLADGKFSTAKGTYFPSTKYQGSESMPCIDIDIIQTSGGRVRAQNRRFLEVLGVVELDEFQLVKSLLEDYYSQENLEFDEGRSIANLRTFITIFKQNRNMYFDLLSKSKILYGHDGRWHVPDEIFIDSPFEHTNMLAYYNCHNRPKTLAALSERYFNSGIDISELIDFAISLGAIRDIPIRRTSCESNPNRSHFLNAPGKRVTNTSINQDWHIQSFEVIERNMDITMSTLILKAIQNLEDQDDIDTKMQAKYRKSHLYETRQGLSQLAYQLRDSAWIPQRNGTFVVPSRAKYEDIPEGFLINRDASWVRHVNFGDDVEIDVADKADQDRRRREALVTLGLDSSKMLELDSLFKKLAEFPLDRIPELVPDLIQRIEESSYSFPEGETVRGSQRGKRVKEEAEEAPDRTGDIRKRKVHLSYPLVKSNAKQYLTQQYTRDGNTFCQICHRPMPFRLDDGSPFVMKVEFLPGFDKRHYRNHLLLCPNHGTMFIHANHDKDNLRDMVLSMKGLELQISLAQSSFTIRFTEQHIHDIKKIMESDQGSSHNDDLDTDEDD